MIRRMLFSLVCLSFLAPVAAGALEVRTTTADLVRSAPYVAHVRVETIRRVPGPVEMYNYQVMLLESYKGELPAVFDVRVMLGSGVVNPSSRPAQPGAEWILILGRKNKYDVYPLRSLTWGRIELFQDRETGEYRLARPVNGFPGQTNPQLSLAEFRARVARLLGKKTGEND